jgi:predicted nucleic acid-binding protein
MPARYAYFDTSVIVKRFLRESGSERARQLLRQYQAITSELVGLESMSAFRRSLATGVIDKRAYAMVVRQFQRDREHLTCVPVNSSILETAEKYVADFNLRAFDAIHLASATDADGVLRRLPFITADSDQREAAARLKLAIIWVG